MSHWDILQWIYNITTSIDGYARVWCWWKYMSQCNIQECHYHIVTFIKIDVALQHSTRVFVILWHISKFSIKCDIKQWQCCIARFIKDHVVLQQKSMVMLQCDIRVSHCITTSHNVVMTHCNVHDSSWSIVTLINCYVPLRCN